MTAPVVETTLEAALLLARDDAHVFPLPARSKASRVRWRDVSTADPEQIAEWLSGSDANYGVDCGKSRLLVLDEDEMGELERLAVDRGEPIPDTFTVRTAHGQHFYFRQPGGLGNRNPFKRTGYKIDVRGEGGYVVGPGSTHESGAVYTLTRSTSPAELPGWLRDLLVAPAESESVPVAPSQGNVPDERYVAGTVAGVLADLAELADLPDSARTDRGDGWDSGAFRAACRLVEAANSGTAYTLDDAEKDFMEHAPAAAGTYDPAYKWSSAKRVVGDAPLAPQGRPREDFSPLTQADPRRALEGDSQDAGQGVVRVAGASSWAGMDLTGYLDGSYQPPVPCLLTRDDGVSLLYPGLTHSIHGESESGKSMLVQHETVRVMMAGGHVLYLDFESDPGSLVDRLVTLGASRKVIGEQFVYLQPSTDPDKYGPDLDALYATLRARPYKLAVIDGVSESMDVVTGESKDPNATAIEWTRKVPRRIADLTGAAVVQIDHVTKNAETRGRFAIGGQAKLSALTGAAYSIDVRQPLGRGLCGELMLRVAKDRPGYVRGRSGAHRPSDRTQEAARVIVDSTGDGLVLTVVAPTAETTAEQAESLLMGRISDFLAELGEEHAGATTTTVRREVRGNNEEIDRAVQALVQQGHVSRTVKAQSHLHRLVKPYLPGQEDVKDD